MARWLAVWGAITGLCVGALVATPWPAAAGEQAEPAATRRGPSLPTLPLSVAVAVEQDQPVVTTRWLRRQLGEANRLLRPHGLSLRMLGRSALPARFAALETPADRDAIAELVQPRVVNLFVVRSLRDIDRPERFIMGVRWRQRRNLRKDCVILSTKALPTTLAHELGHYFGNPHSPVDNNIMSYQRSDPKAVRFDASQGARMRQIARQHLRSGRLVAAPTLLPPAAAAGASPE